ncbi:hypothetical protein OCO53_25735 [Peribacillus frigoritolerans]|uniref:hypothetical protein n=1 Tax=Peribacillus frigoritolerans TaxID=450367 RepID=UPI0021D1F377|nr:hypothetical protein [Peribacillus frigoritolerans]MCU6603846.1 hypothetical protein [Peribacillus frigoritolerans]
MAEHAYFFNSTDNDPRLYDAEDFAIYFKKFLLNGVYDDGDELAVTADEGAGMFVTVGTGSAFLEGHLYVNDAPLQINLDAPDPTLDRIDRVILRLDRTQDVRNIYAAVLKGTPAASPTLPTMRKDEYVYEFPLAQVRITKGKSYVDATQITDERTKAIHAFSPEQIGTYSAETLDTFQKYKITPDDGLTNHYFDETTDDLFSISKNLETFYSKPGVKNHPPMSASVRGIFISEKLGYGEMLAMGYDGSIWRATKTNGTWYPWNKMLGMNDFASNKLWQGTAYPYHNYEIFPSKKLSECRNGWMLIWSDYDYSVGANNFHWVQTPVHKGFLKDHSMAGHFFSIQSQMSGTSFYVTGKALDFYDNKIVGGEFNDAPDNGSRDVCLRYIYEF